MKWAGDLWGVCGSKFIMLISEIGLDFGAIQSVTVE
jgi:hypothetical protein